MKKIVFLVLALMVIFPIFSLADVDTGFSCSLDCSTLSQNGDSYYCNPNTQTCFLEEEVPPEQADPAIAPPASTTNEKITVLEEKIANLENNLVTLSSDLSLTKGEILTIQSQISTLQSELATLESTEQDLSSKTNTIATGLAGLQESLGSLQNTLSERQSFGRFITIIFVILLLGGAGWGVYYYIHRKETIVNPEITKFIHNSIKQGKKLHQIKRDLRQAGWMDSDIDKVYNETVKQNYQRYKTSKTEAKTVASPEQPSARKSSTQKLTSNLAYNPKKMIAIAVVSIIIIISILLVLQASTGQAIFLKKMIGGEENGTSGEVTYKTECTPPHLLNPAGDACCLDSDNSGVCDTIELQGPGLGKGGECNDNRECSYGLYCMNSAGVNTCNSLSSLYTGQGDCSKLCSYYAVKIFTSDGETYDLKPKQGSYTAAGALEWKTLQMPQHCKGESPIVPINILNKVTGEVISEKVIWLHEGQTSEVLTHPNLTKIAFTLTVADVFESCPE